MLKLYCQKCGSLNAYVSEKPNFRQRCGQGIGQLEATSSVPQDDLTGDETVEPRARTDFNLNELDIEIDTSARNRSTVGNLVGTGEEGQLLNRPVDTGGQNYTKEDFKREAGSIRGGNEPEET